MRTLACLFLLPALHAQDLQALVERLYPKKDDRMKEYKLPEIARQLAIQTGSRVADLGCGPGDFVIFLSHVVGPQGRVYAVDIDADTLKGARGRFKKEKLRNVDAILGLPENPKLPAGLDAILSVRTYHEYEKLTEILAAVRAALKPGGVFVVVDQWPNRTRDRSREVQLKNHVLVPSLVEDDLKKAGFEIVHRADSFLDDADKEEAQWLIAARPHP